MTEEGQTFKEEVKSRLGGERINLCYQCGACVGGCPMASAAPKIFYPRLIVQWVQLGLKERVLLSDDIWLCAFCYQCHERCPQGLSLPEIWLVLRNLAVERGHIPERPAFLVKNLIKSGRTLHMSEGTDDWREAAGLPRVGLTIPEKTLAEIRSIVKTTGFDKKLKLGEE